MQWNGAFAVVPVEAQSLVSQTAAQSNVLELLGYNFLSSDFCGLRHWCTTFQLPMKHIKTKMRQPFCVILFPGLP
jgi:hypothetical protein